MKSTAHIACCQKPGAIDTHNSPVIIPGKLDVNILVEIVNQEYAENLNLDELARRFGVNPSYLSRSFTEKTGAPLFDYINRIRIRKACILLKRSDLNILEIAYSVGYHNPSHFNRSFKKIMGIAPRDYRKSLQ